MQQEIKIRSVSLGGRTELRVSVPHYPEFVRKAYDLGGRWNLNDREWEFDSHSEEQVRALLRRCFGVDGSEQSVETVTVRVNMDGLEYYDELWACGRCIARRPDRYSPVYLGEGVFIVRGGFPPRAGTRRAGLLFASKGTVLEIRDVPRSLAEAEAVRLRGMLQIVDEQPGG